MNTRSLITLCALCLCALALPLLPACQNGRLPVTGQIGTTGGTNLNGAIVVSATTNLDIGVAGGADLTTGEWNVNLVVTFKGQPGAATQQWADRIGLVAVTRGPGPTYQFVYDPANPAHQQFIQFALHDGATLSSTAE